MDIIGEDEDYPSFLYRKALSVTTLVITKKEAAQDSG